MSPAEVSLQSNRSVRPLVFRGSVSRHAAEGKRRSSGICGAGNHTLGRIYYYSTFASNVPHPALAVTETPPAASLHLKLGNAYLDCLISVVGRNPDPQLPRCDLRTTTENPARRIHNQRRRRGTTDDTENTERICLLSVFSAVILRPSPPGT